MSRFAMLAWSAAMGLIIGLIGGVMVLAVLVIASELTLVPARLAERYRSVALVILLGVVPVIGLVLGLLEGRGKLE